MNLSAIKESLEKIDSLKFILPDGTQVPSHFHVTEVGKVTRHFIDCGGTERLEEVINFQLWTDEDVDHRLQSKKLIDIIKLSEKKLNLNPNAEIKVEYQGKTIETYGLKYEDGTFKLTQQQTDCLAKDKCGIPEKKHKMKLSELQSQISSCSPNSGCC